MSNCSIISVELSEFSPHSFDESPLICVVDDDWMCCGEFGSFGVIEDLASEIEFIKSDVFADWFIIFL